MKHLVECFPEATTRRGVLDHLNPHKPASLYEAFPPEEARYRQKAQIPLPP